MLNASSYVTDVTGELTFDEYAILDIYAKYSIFYFISIFAPGAIFFSEKTARNRMQR